MDKHVRSFLFTFVIMSKKRGNKRVNVVYSTNEDFSFDEYNEDDTLDPADQELTVHREKKGRGGKTVIIVREFVGKSEDLESLAKQIKKSCGVGGSVKDGEIIIQGDCRPKVMDILSKEGFTPKQVGG